MCSPSCAHLPNDTVHWAEEEPLLRLVYSVLLLLVYGAATSHQVLLQARRDFAELLFLMRYVSPNDLEL